MTNFTALKNILFDVGGVILDLNINATLEAFYNMGFPADLLKYPENYNTDIFHRYETGKVSTGEFRDSIRKSTGVKFEDSVFDDAWRAMLINIPGERIELMKKLKSKFDLYILSNTSALHTPVFENLFQQNGTISMKELFKECFYSHEIGYNKPDEEAFKYVLKKAKIEAGETLFLDDNIQNIKAAKSMGFNAIHISKHMDLLELGFDL